jgi:hypothetical protein
LTKTPILVTACKRHNPAAGATQGYDRLHAKRYRKPYDDIANIKRTDMKRTFLNNMGQRTTLIAKATAEKKQKKMPPHEKILLPTHIAHICLCQLTHMPTQRQSQKSAISNALLHYQ